MGMGRCVLVLSRLRGRGRVEKDWGLGVCFGRKELIVFVFVIDVHKVKKVVVVHCGDVAVV